MESVHFFCAKQAALSLSPALLPLASPLARFCSDSIEPLSLWPCDCGGEPHDALDGRTDARTEERTYKLEDKTRRKDVKSFPPKKYGVAKGEVE